MSALPILILPGTLCTRLMFEQQISCLKKHCDSVSVVQFTDEASLEEMAASVIAATKNQPAALIGFSMGGIVAMQLARTHPHLIGKLALINSNSHADLPERKAGRATQIQQAQTGKLSTLIGTDFMPNYLFQQQQSYRQLIVDMALSLGADCFAAQVMALEDRTDSLTVLQRLCADILIIGGQQDKICPPAHQFDMHTALPNSDLLLLGQCGHFSPLEQADKVSNALTQWYLQSGR
ncbi:alpha/beta hydrolase [Thalassotalea fonticola]|uniref:Alpha/beta hydrolase n=1 Tax=Thalassotalea fonticola TaxID=3065649 RepID=A0ABZ0GIN4_9GAMM|nr:alpha/beta hydrolase [Colwelliaceae bacterium S1-1]